MVDGGGWRKNIFDFYTVDGAAALSRFLKFWKGGRMVVNVAEMPIKCPVAPLEFLFLADWFFHQRGIRDKVEIVYATPLPGAFTKPRASAVLGDMLEEKGIHLEPDFDIMEVDNDSQVIRSYDKRESGLRSAGHRAYQHGRRGDRAFGNGGRAEFRADRQAHPAIQPVGECVGDRRCQPTCPPLKLAR